MDFEKAYEEALERAKQGMPIDEVFPELKESEDERTRKDLIAFICQFAPEHLKTEYVAYLERKKDHFRDDTKMVEQQPADSDVIKGGDFISDGKRVFLVLANVKERNLGETDSTFCEGHILGVDGVVYCNGDNFKKFKRATSNERAKFIHDLKVGVELKEQTAEWSEEEMRKIVELKYFITQCNGFNKENRKKAFDMIDAFRPRPHWKPSEEQINALQAFVGMIHPDARYNAVSSLLDELKAL